MVNLEPLKDQNFKGVINSIEEMPLNDYLNDAEIIEKFRKGVTRFPRNVVTKKEREDFIDTRLETNVLVIRYTVKAGEKEQPVSEFFNIPTITGWGRSKLKSIRDMNNLTYQTDEWIGKEVKVSINKDGYFRLVPD